MSVEKHIFNSGGSWTGNCDGDGALHLGSGEQLDFGLPEQTGGKPGRSNPEELLLGALLSCYCITLSILAEKRRLPLLKIDAEASCELERQADKTLKIVRICIKPKLTLDSNDEKVRNTALDSAYKAEAHCLISKALHGDIEITVEPEIAGSLEN